MCSVENISQVMTVILIIHTQRPYTYIYIYISLKIYRTIFIINYQLVMLTSWAQFISPTLLVAWKHVLSGWWYWNCRSWDSQHRHCPKKVYWDFQHRSSPITVSYSRDCQHRRCPEKFWNKQHRHCLKEVSFFHWLQLNVCGICVYWVSYKKLLISFSSKKFDLLIK